MSRTLTRIQEYNWHVYSAQQPQAETIYMQLSTEKRAINI